MKESEHNAPVYITFAIGDDEFAADIGRVEAIVPVKEIVHAGKASFSIRFDLPDGVTNAWIVDLHVCLNIRRVDIDHQTRILMVRSAERHFAFLVDAVKDLICSSHLHEPRDDDRIFLTRGNVLVRQAFQEDRMINIIDFSQITHALSAEETHRFVE